MAICNIFGNDALVLLQESRPLLPPTHLQTADTL